MSQRNYYLLIIFCNILLLFIYIFKQNMILAMNRHIQKEENNLKNYTKQCTERYNDIQKLQQHSVIKKRAEKELGMRPTKLDQIVNLNDLKDEEPSI